MEKQSAPYRDPYQETAKMYRLVSETRTDVGVMKAAVSRIEGQTKELTEWKDGVDKIITKLQTAEEKNVLARRALIAVASVILTAFLYAVVQGTVL